MPLFHLTPGQYRGFVRYFQTHATAGVMGKHDLRAVLAKHNIRASNSEIQEMIDSISVDAHGIGLQAFIDYMSTWSGFRDQDHEFAECFRIYDRSGKGVLTRDDIKYVMTKLGNDKLDVEALLDEADRNRDGVIQYEEFVELMRRH